MTKPIIRRALLASACSLALSAPAFAQEAAEENSNEIIVTAQNREQSLNDVPIAIDVVGSEELRDAGFGSMNDIDKIAPVVQLNQDQGTVKVTVRGVGTGSNDEAQDTSVVVNIDGEYINRGNVLGSALFDVERVEVLRGPQGTLYGRNSTGGAINFITRKPGTDFGVNASVSYGNYDAIRFDGGVDLPLGSTAAVRVAGFYDERDGYVNHPARGAFGPFPAFAGGRSDDNRNYGGRISLRFDPSDQLSINLAGEMADRRYTPQAFASRDLNSGGVGPSGPGCNASGFTQIGTTFPETVNVNNVPTIFQRTLCRPSNTNFLSAVDRSSYFAPNFGLGRIGNDTYALRGKIAYEFSDAATITYTAGYRSYSGDSDSFVTLPVVYRSFSFMDEADTQSHELRLNGQMGSIIYQVGGFYFKEKLERESGFFLRLVNPPAAACPTCGQNGTFLSYFGRDVVSKSKSVFGQVDVPISDTLTAVGGLRYTDSKRRGLYRNTAFVGAMGFDPAISGAGPGRKRFSDLRYVTTLNLRPAKEDKVTWLAGLNFKPNPDTLVFAKASTGFKAGGFDSVGAYKPETNTALEIGWKQSFGGSSQHQFNLGAFHYDYKDLQVSVLLDTNVGGQTFNAGKAKIWGVEASASIALDDNNHFNASFNYLNAEYKNLLASFNVYCLNDSPPTACGINGVGDLDPNTAGVQQPNFAGNRPAFSPEFIITAGYDHVFDMGNTGTVTAAVNTTLKSSYFTDFFNNRDGTQKSFTQTDFSLTFKPLSEKFTVQAFVKNIENTRALTFGSYTSAGPDDIFNWQFGTPRTYGVRLSVDF